MTPSQRFISLYQWKHCLSQREEPLHMSATWLRIYQTPSVSCNSGIWKMLCVNTRIEAEEVWHPLGV